MSADNNHLKNREIQALREEQPRPDAKAELILALSKQQRESKMSILRKATLPTLVSVAAIAGVFFVAQPKVVAATPERVIKAIQDIKNYTINSFAIEGNVRHLQSKTTVNGKDRKTVYYDKDGKETKGGVNGAFVMMNDSPMKMGFHVGPDGNLKDMSKADIEKIKGQIVIKSDDVTDGAGLGSGDKKEVRVQVTKDANGKEVKHIFVNGKEVDKLPEGIHIGEGGAGKNEVKVMVNKGADGKEVKHIFVNGKEVDKLPDGVKVNVKNIDNQEFKVMVDKDANGNEVKKYYVNGKEVDKLPDGMQQHFIIKSDGMGKGKKGELRMIKRDGVTEGGTVMINAQSVKGGKGSISKSMAVVGGKNGGKPMIVQSGQTSADYLVNLLKDTSRWTIERGVTFNGQKLDKFMLKGPISPIVLYVDPSSALPKVLQFGTPMQEGVTIEDVYVYGNQP